MKKTKLDQRINNAFNTFFDDDRENSGEDRLSFVHDSALLASEPAAQFNNKGDRVVKFLKRAFLFLPGAFYLFFGTLTAFSFEFFRANPLSLLAAFAIGSFMTIFGIGSLKNPKHLAIPVSIVAVAIAAFWIFFAIGNLKFVFWYGIYFFPLALIAALLAKNLTDDKK
ncbi:MAG TPA: hypothetical protein VNB22_22410 [Pyrinomonadaceae bacterium]|nr:hypothetical protein [Pyrinomonadaceae bacterium]